MIQDFTAIQNIADTIISAATHGPVAEPDGFVNLASWVGVNTHAWQAAMFFRDASDHAWFCHVDRDWQQTYLLMVGAEMRWSVASLRRFSSSQSKQNV